MATLKERVCATAAVAWGGESDSYSQRALSLSLSLSFVRFNSYFISVALHFHSLAIPLAKMGADISASDISDAMSTEADRRAKEMGISNAKFYTSDLESVTGNYDTVTCVDVAIHYPTEQMTGMIKHLCGLSDRRVIFSFAPKTWWFVGLKKFGELFPGPSKTTRAYLHQEEDVRKALEDAGFKIAREEFTGTNFYFSKLFEAVKA